MKDGGATHELYRRRHDIKGSSDRAFGVVFAVFFTIVGLWPLTAGLGATDRLNWWGFGVAAVVLAAALACPAVLGPANRLWFRFGQLLHRVVSPLVMAVLFFVVLTPFAVVMRLAGRDPMRRVFDSEAASYWIAREPGPTPDSMKNQF